MVLVSGSEASCPDLLAVTSLGLAQTRRPVVTALILFINFSSANLNDMVYFDIIMAQVKGLGGGVGVYNHYSIKAG